MHVVHKLVQAGPSGVNTGISPRHLVEIHLNPGEAPGLIDYVVEAQRGLRRGTGPRVNERAATKAIALVSAGMQVAMSRQAWGCSGRDLRRAFQRLSASVGHSMAKAESPEAAATLGELADAIDFTLRSLEKNNG